MAGDFLVSIKLDGKGFFPTIQEMTKETEKLKSSLGALDGFLGKIKGVGAAVGLYAISDAIKQLIERADQIKDRSNALNLSTTRVQQIGNVTDFDQARSAIEQLAQAQQAILSGKDQDDTKLKAFAQLGVTLDDIKKKDFPALFDQLADSINRVAINGARLTAIKEIFGKSGGRLVEGFQKGLDSDAANRGVLTESDIEGLAKTKEDIKGSRTLGLIKDMLTGGAGFAGRLFASNLRSSEIIGGATAQVVLGGETGSDGAQQYRARIQQEKLDERARTRAEAAIKEKEAKEQAEKEAEKQQRIKEATEKMRLENEEKLDSLFRKSLSVEERKKQIAKERSDIQRDMLRTGDEQKRQELIAKDLRLADEAQGLKRTTSYRIETDSLSRIGLFRGGSGDVLGTAIRQQLDELRGIHRGIDILNANISQD